ncbi:MAG: bifunctional [glutamate--ammonia ligase]-adenylyl-L-tyrosine phosphorylase/[glutamate--ammonia-ligase] adenylyltransferase [Desulfobacteraceae bacterium]|nr:bifunctional [glutamate--ammonia ligase]-adenylyl-L-tyrosine phosphorylase/[glutamate--ammonia-ligase] adenylyltransferase [Desulfobacteraceae bacterium]
MEKNYYNILEQETKSHWNKLKTAVENQGHCIASWQKATVKAIIRILAHSDFVVRECSRHPYLLDDLICSGDIAKSYSIHGYFQRLANLWKTRLGAAIPIFDKNQKNMAHLPDCKSINKDQLQQTLRLFRRREMVRIAIRDLCGWSDLDETLAELSSLADTCIGGALNQLHYNHCTQSGSPVDKQGRAQQLVVLGLGKLGAQELNFSSDVDLMFAYPCDGETQGGGGNFIANEIFFLRVCRDLIQTIGANTADGFVFRVDSRLRPYGEVGPLVHSFEKLEDYYLNQGREWERYALIKARVVAGCKASGSDLLNRLKPFIFRRYLDYGAFDGLRGMKSRISMEVRNKGLADDIKLGPGGIREIEFFGQMFQLIRAGVEPALQVRPIREVLNILVENGYIPEKVKDILDKAYVFLRTVENRLQQYSDQQVHKLPADPYACHRLAVIMGFEHWQGFLKKLDYYRGHVHEQFQDLLAPKEEKAAASSQDQTIGQLKGIWKGYISGTDQLEILKNVGFKNPQNAQSLIDSLRQDHAVKYLSKTGRERLNKLIPLLLKAVGQAHEPEMVLNRVFDLIKSIRRRTAYLALLLENPAVLTHLVRLSEASSWIASFLSLHPVLLDELLDPRTLYKPSNRNDLDRELNQRLDSLDPEDLEYHMEVMRIFKQSKLLRVAASDITHVLPLMKVSDHLSDIAEIVLKYATSLCWQTISKKYGLPRCQLDGRPCQRGFAIIAYGKLGGLELRYRSDLDLVFLHAAEPGQTAGSDRNIDNALYFSRLGQRLLHFLTTPTSAGILYETDMRLRPSGDSGLLVSHINSFRNYQQNDAWTWEHQALIRARAITGDAELRQRFEDIRKEILTKSRQEETLKKEVIDMRGRLRKAAPKTCPATFDIKDDPGGIIDIEFLVQYLVLLYAHKYPDIVRWTDNVRLLQALNESGILDNTTAFGLRRAYLIYRAMTHRFGLRQQPAVINGDRFSAAREFVIRTWNRFLK